MAVGLLLKLLLLKLGWGARGGGQGGGGCIRDGIMEFRDCEGLRVRRDLVGGFGVKKECAQLQ